MVENPMIATRMTAAAYRELPTGDKRTELIDGEFLVSTSPVDRHQLVSINSVVYLGTRLGNRRLRYESDLYLTETDVPRPDIFWIHPQNTRCQLVAGYWHGTPDLVVEILSPSTTRLDRGKKYHLYERCGVPEYWIMDPDQRTLEVYTLKNGQYVRFGFYEPDEGVKFESPVTGIVVEVPALFDGVEVEIETEEPDGPAN